MKKIISSIAFLLLALLCPEAIAAQQPRPEPGKIIIKFKENSLAAMQWTGAARTGEIAFLKKIIGSHTTRPFVGDNVLKAVQKKLNGQNPRRTNQSSLVESLSRIALVEITQPLEVQTLLLKISSYPDIEYAEPQYTRLIYEIPDDPLLSQQSYLQQVRVFDAWDNIAEPARRPIVAIVDTGVDYLHEDLVSNIFINTGEDGADTQGRSRRNNGVDDDANGFVDDWRGWDFTAIGNSSAQDNDPMPGHPHGTHVAGLAGAVTNNSVGIASAGRWVQILPVKIGPSDPNSLSVYNSYEGILYAATMGADVINSSWGGPGSSEAEKEITDAALALGSLIVAAAGNDNIEGGFYPAAYPGVISVASVSGTDVKSSFSNYHMSVDVSAPGDQIFSTVPGNSYTHMSGTSMASPIAAGIAALIKIQFPHYTPLQIGAQLKATTDSIDFRNNQQYHSRLGSGRINALKAITETNVRAALITNFTIEDADQDSILEAGEELKVYFTLHNVLAAINNARIEVSSITSISPLFLQKVISVGTMGTNEIRSITDPVIFTIPTDVPYNYDFQLAVDITDNQGRVSREVINITVRPSYRTFSSNNITATFNSEGNIGFNDYPTNIQGKGFYYKGSDNLLYEGALIAGIS
ncbi:MAG TPA: S8 family peptidase, partial [Patescibacteria group bacterium]|nr:S8 family peptidase [Patescibacteria group bacterium]